MPTRKNKNITQIVNRVNRSSANFVNRLKDSNRKYIKDWESERIATHKLGVSTDEHGNNYIYPEVQEINGKLIDFTRPPYHPFAGVISAEERGDTVRVNSIEDGLLFTENYKNYYPKGKTFKLGGRTKARFGLEDGVPTQEEYIAQQIAAKKAAALDKSRNRTEPAIPLIERKLSPEEINFRNRIGYAKINQLNDELVQTLDNKQAANIKKEIDKELDNLKKTTTLCQGASCIYTATDNYGKQYKVSGNQTFAANPSKYGFKEVPNDSIQPSDIVQFISRNTPYHAVIYDSKDATGENLYNYSDGGYGAKNIKIKKHMPGNNYKTYTFVGTPADSTQWINEYKQKYGNGMRCGGRRKAQLGLDIREGGIAIPIAPNMYYMDGRSHDDGGIAIGPNNKNGLEVEGGEVVKVGNNDIKVFSSVPLLRGVSPAQLVMGGANPNKVFKAQENFKDINRINDDGTTYEMGGEGKPKSKRSRPVTGVLPYGYTIRNLYAVENPYRKGIKGNTAKMYDNRTLGAGVDVVSGHPELYKKAKSGKMTKQKADETAVIHIRKDDDVIRNNYADVYGKAAADTLSYGPRFLVAQARYQQGNVRKAWSPIHEAMAKGDAKALKKAVLQVTPKDHTYRRKWIEDFKVYKMGGMIYTINGNVKNGLMSVRPKAEFGKNVKYPYVDGNRRYYINNGDKIYSDGQIVDEKGYGKYYVLRDKNRNFLGYSIDENGNRELAPVFNEKIAKEAYEYSKNKRPQYYAEKELPLFDSQSIAEKSGLARSGWSYADSPTFDYVPKINISVPTNYAKAVGDNTKTNTSSTPRGRGTKSSKPETSTKPANVEAKQPKLVERPKENLYITGIKNNAVKSPLMSGMKKISANPASSSTGGGTQSKDGNWVPQYNLITGRDWLGVGTNLAGHIASYFANRDILDKYPMPTKPVMTPAVKLKTRVNINPDLTNSKEAELMGIEATNRNTSSSNTSLARNQRIMNEGRDARNKLYAYKENAETQLINQDKLNRQGVYARNVAAYNDWLNKTYVAKTNKLLAKQQNLMSLINGIPMAVNNVLGNIETRKSTNDMIQAIAAANPNGDGRLLGIGDYYTQQLANGKIAKYNKNHKFIKYV